MRKIGQLKPLLQAFDKMTFDDRRLLNPKGLNSILSQHPKTITIFNHASPLSWFPAILSLSMSCYELGHDDRCPVGIMHRMFYKLPGLKQLASFITQLDDMTSSEEILKVLSVESAIDLVIFPEGSNCFFGLPEHIQDFRSIKFIELAYQAKVPILAVVHRGSEIWGKAIDIAEFNPFGLKTFTIPRLPERLSAFRYKVFLFEPILSEKSSKAYRESMKSEANRFLRQMQKVHSELALKMPK